MIRSEVVERNLEAFQDVRAGASALQFVLGAAANHFLPVVDIFLKHALDWQHARLQATLDQRQHVDAKRRLHLRVLVQRVEHLLWLRVLLQNDHETHAGAVGFIADIADALDLALFYQLGNSLAKPGLVDLEWQLGDNNVVGTARRFLDVRLGPQGDMALAGAIGVHNAFGAQNQARGWKVGAWHHLDDIFDRSFRIIDQQHDRVAQLGQVVRWNVGGHTDSNTGCAIEQQVWQARRQHGWLAKRAIEIIAKINRVLIEVEQHLFGQRRKPRLGVAHCSGRIAVDTAEVTLAVDQQAAHVPRLREACQRVVHRRIAMRVHLAHDIADDTGALFIGQIMANAHIPHSIQNAALHRLEAIAHVWQGARDDDAHCVVQIGSTHLFGDAARPYDPNLHCASKT